jgi:hypothetical protein
MAIPTLHVRIASPLNIIARVVFSWKDEKRRDSVLKIVVFCIVRIPYRSIMALGIGSAILDIDG